MGNRADDYGTDVEFYVKALTSTIYAATPTGASEKLLALLDRLGLERQEVRTGGPVYVWHTVPDHLSEVEQKRLATRAIPALLVAGYKVNIDPDLFDEAAYQQAAREVRARQPRAATRSPASPAASPPTAAARRTP
ncbi:hypothetical protein ACFVG1_20755 [Streptomyces bacillaris]|uniref:hypothetical protein n=1 Tax=Streptomyces TaxID=1883 RepID=UPI002270F771|nr:hypothetical protein [Streptomyces tirandamycinicus]MCY0979438.1 hypothetical protein [Streptomyces tirandamycinicus]